jgi:hypothetical protein
VYKGLGMEKDKIEELFNLYQNFSCYYHICLPIEKPLIAKSLAKIKDLILPHLKSLG